jgi:hypothetical protein
MSLQMRTTVGADYCDSKNWLAAKWPVLALGVAQSCVSWANVELTFGFSGSRVVPLS